MQDCTLPLPRSGSRWNHAKPTLFEMAMETSQFPPDWDCDAWLRFNEINTSEKLADLQYALYHRCSRGAFRVSRSGGRGFEIVGENSTLTVPNNGMRQYMISQLRKLTVRVMRRAWRASKWEAL